MLSIIQTANQSGCISLRQRRHNQSDHSKLRGRFLRLLKTLVVSLVSAPFAESCGVLKSQVSIFFSFFFFLWFQSSLVYLLLCLFVSVCLHSAALTLCLLTFAFRLPAHLSRCPLTSPPVCPTPIYLLYLYHPITHLLIRTCLP